MLLFAEMAVAVLVFLLVLVLWILWRTVRDDLMASKCNEDCNQGRTCTCDNNLGDA